MDRGRDGMMEGNGERDGGGRDELREVDLSTVDVLKIVVCLLLLFFKGNRPTVWDQN